MGDPEYLIPLQPLIILFPQHIHYLNLYQNNLQRFKFYLVYNIRCIHHKHVKYNGLNNFIKFTHKPFMSSILDYNGIKLVLIARLFLVRTLK